MTNHIPLSTPHAHCEFCDGRSSAEEMVLSAISQGFVSLGISSHFDFPDSVSPNREQQYIDHIRTLSARYRDQIRLWLGAERDYFSDADPKKFDYTLGSVHYFILEEGHVSVDGNLQALRQFIDSHFNGSGASMAIAYYRMLGQYIESFKPDIIGHFDLVMRHNRHHELFDPNDPNIMKAAREAMEQAIQGCRLLEVNTGAIPRFGASSPYPELPLLIYWRKLGGEVILSSDCHDATQISGGYTAGLQRIQDAGYRHMYFLGTGSKLFEVAEI